MKVLNCTLTQSDTEIIKHYGKQEDGTYHTGVDVAATSVFSICNSVVIDIAVDSNGKHVVTVQYDADRCIRYSNLVIVAVRLGEPIRRGYRIGEVAGHVHFELLSRTPANSFPVRVGAVTYFRVDPTAIILSGRLN